MESKNNINECVYKPETDSQTTGHQRWGEQLIGTTLTYANHRE